MSNLWLGQSILFSFYSTFTMCVWFFLFLSAFDVFDCVWLLALYLLYFLWCAFFVFLVRIATAFGSYFVYLFFRFFSLYILHCCFACRFLIRKRILWDWVNGPRMEEMQKTRTCYCMSKVVANHTHSHKQFTVHQSCQQQNNNNNNKTIISEPDDE